MKYINYDFRRINEKLMCEALMIWIKQSHLNIMRFIILYVVTQDIINKNYAH